MKSLEKIRSRPRFKLISLFSQEEYTEILKKYLLKNKSIYHGNINREMATFSVKNNSDAFWKPYLSIRTEEENGKTIIRGVFGPSSAVWTFFMFLYFLWGIMWMVLITLWFVGKQIKITDYQWGLLASFLVIFFTAITYIASLVGQNKAKIEMITLRRLVIESTLPLENDDEDEID